MREYLYKGNMNFREKISYLWLIIILVTVLFSLVSIFVEMPYDAWLLANMPFWLAIVDIAVLGCSLIILSLPNISQTMNYVAGTVFSVAFMFSKVSVQKAMYANIPIFVISVIIVWMIRGNSRQMDGDSTSTIDTRNDNQQEKG